MFTISNKIVAFLPPDTIEPQAMQQLVNTSESPVLAHHLAVMPDCHFGKGSTVGSVIPTAGGINNVLQGSKQLEWSLNAVLYAFSNSVDVTRSLFNDLGHVVDLALLNINKHEARKSPVACEIEFAHQVGLHYLHSQNNERAQADGE